MNTFPDIDEIHPTARYARFIQKIGWKAEKVDNSYIYYRMFPFFGGFAKLQRPRTLPSISAMKHFIKQKHIRLLAAEPTAKVRQSRFDAWCRLLQPHVRLSKTPHIPTKTLLIDLQPDPDAIFARFDESKRRGIRKAVKNGVTVTVSHNICDFLALKSRSAGLFGGITVTGMNHLWNMLAPTHADVLMAYVQSDIKPIAGIFMIRNGNTASYWIAGAIKKAKQLHAPTLLIWEAVKLAKSKKCRWFDFVGVWDERIPKNGPEWKGFTKFKEGFGTIPLYYPISPYIRK